MENSVRGKDMETTRDKVIRMILEEMDSKIEASEFRMIQIYLKIWKLIR